MASVPSFFLHSLLLLLLPFSSLGFDPPDNLLLNCGSPTNTTVGSRVFLSDSPFLSPSSNPPANTTSSSSSSSSSTSEFSTLCPTARILTQTSTYKFKITKSGRHWLRLYFCPFTFQNFHMSTSKFSVSLNNGLLLLKNPTPTTTTTTNNNNTSFIKEFSLNLSPPSVDLIFTPLTTSFAYINAIELLSLPEGLISDDAQSLDPQGKYTGLDQQVLETINRVNMGGPLVTPLNDSLWRTWVSDATFLLHPSMATTVSNTAAVDYRPGGPSPDAAPPSVYGTATTLNSAMDPRSNFNVTWEFAVSQGSRHLLRYHFCDIVSKSIGQIIFNVYAGPWIVASDLDLAVFTFNVLSSPYYMDVVTPPLPSSKLLLSIGPSDLNSQYPNAFLNGLEIMRILSNNNPPFSPLSKPNTKKTRLYILVSVCVSSFLSLLLLGCLFLSKKRRKNGVVGEGNSKTWVPFFLGERSGTVMSQSSNNTLSSIASVYSYRFPLAAVQEATRGFDESLVIGTGGFGKVYKGVLGDGTTVAVKRGSAQSQQGVSEFRTEIELLSQFRHRHLVSLIGYCDEREEMVLIYEYMEKGTLKSHLYGGGLPCLSWKERLEICIGAAKGLHYLHTGHSKAVIHRDVKSANILVDERLMAKVADFGLSKTGPEIDQTHVSTAVKGSFGYLDPEYFRRQQLTEKSDVYSFGVVLLEVVCARAVIDPSLSREMVNLAEWGMKWQRRGELERIVDPRLVGSVRPESLRKFGETVEKCLAEYGAERPSMGDVLWNLEYALQLQEMGVGRGGGGGDDEEDASSVVIADISPLVMDMRIRGQSDSARLLRKEEEEEEEEEEEMAEVFPSSMSRVFSEMVKSEGR